MFLTVRLRFPLVQPCLLAVLASQDGTGKDGGRSAVGLKNSRSAGKGSDVRWRDI